jgi:heme-degrading monooxygenase HmoA
MMTEIAKTPTVPYYAVIFTSLRTPGDQGYGDMAIRVAELAAQQPGYLGIESVREGLGITISYWRDVESIRRCKANLEHTLAQRLGRDRWYEGYKVRVCRVEYDYDFQRTAQEEDT